MISIRHVKYENPVHHHRVCRTLLNGRYYEPHGSLQYRLAHTLAGEGWAYGDKYDLFVAYSHGRIAGYCVYIPQRNGVEFYVTPRYRRQGVATKLVKAVRKITGLSVLCAQHGFEGSEHFFRHNLIYVENHDSVYRQMSDVAGPHYHMLPADRFIKLYKNAVRVVKLRLHHALRKYNATLKLQCGA